MGLLERISTARGRRGGDEQRFSIDTWISDYLIPAANQFAYGGTSYPLGLGLSQTFPGTRVAEVSSTLPGYFAAIQACPPAFAAQMVRALVLSQARFTFRNPPSARTPRRPFGTSELAILERPWPNATTGELLSRMEWHAGLAGNAFVVRQPSRLRVLRPDWCALVYGSEQEPDDAAHALDGELVGLVYANGGFGGRNQPITLLPDEFAHWSPIGDPLNAGIGMSWLTPAIRDLQGDRAMTEHKLKFLSQGATPNLVISGIPAATKEQFDEIVELLEERHTGLANAYRTLYLTVGADAKVIGSDLKQLEFATTQARGETRLSVLSRVPAAILGISEGLAGSTLNAGNFGMARRLFADTWVYPTLQDLAAALAPLLRVPSDAELWFDTGDMPLLREDAKDAAEIEQIKAATIRQLVDGGFEPGSVIAAVQGQDIGRLIHSGMLSVQLQEPGTVAPDPNANGNGQGNGKVPARELARLLAAALEG